VNGNSWIASIAYTRLMSSADRLMAVWRKQDLTRIRYRLRPIHAAHCDALRKHIAEALHSLEASDAVTIVRVDKVP
jgi:hypothetical protein